MSLFFNCASSLETFWKLNMFWGASSLQNKQPEILAVTRGTMVRELGGWVILSRMPNSVHMSIKMFDGWSADSLIYDALKSDTRSMGCSCGKSSLSPGALNHWARVDQLHEGILRYSPLFSSARKYKKKVIGCRYSVNEECRCYLEIPSKHWVCPNLVRT